MVDYYPHDREMVEIRIIDVEEEVNKNCIDSENSVEQMIQIKVEGTDIEAGEEQVSEKITGSQFKQFDFIYSTAQDEKGIAHNQKLNHSGIERHNRLMQEWKILKMGLPDSTYVRVYDNDVVRAVIIGGAGTPYRDGLFFFDIILPLNYPSVPPEVHCYYSSALSYLHGAGIDPYRIDTRLADQSRKLLVAKWNQNTSTILDILVSIQLIFQTENPYFGNHGMNINDPRLKEAIKIGYKLDETFDCNERVFKANCRTMLVTLKNPPKGFEEFVAQHFRSRTETILTACNPYKVKCGEYPRYETKMCREYQESMAHVYSLLLKAFEKNVSSLDGFVGDINLVEDDSGHVRRTTGCDENIVIPLFIFAFILTIWFFGSIVAIVQAISKTLR
ncbi:hypothetical protein MKW94_020376 [Papaver nudicaule]|uniref:UBC core domain-containing protein n=1 Tax=Papaver nudicaule TaxID=74823 RepID=A0AA41RY80_PAPNU|nr:hypothetical protein [Papaver nudicaule]